jgi:two-component system, LytTR family, response regulator LytT
MENQNNNYRSTERYPLIPSRGSEDALDGKELFLNQSQKSPRSDVDDLLEKLTLSAGKRSFLVFKSNKYMSVLTENIALFYVKYESSVIMCFDKQEYLVNQSLEQIQSALSDKQFFRLNRQYLINFKAIKEAQHYFARKLVVNLVVPFKEKLLVPRERVTSFLRWLDNR